MAPIHYACRYRTVEIVNYLSIKCKLEAESVNKLRPIHYACIYGSEKMIKLFVDKNVDLEAENINNGAQFIMHVDINQQNQ